MYDSYSSDKAANPDEPCTGCGKVDCTCDEDYEQWRDEEMRREDEQEISLDIE